METAFQTFYRHSQTHSKQMSTSIERNVAKERERNRKRKKQYWGQKGLNLFSRIFFLRLTKVFSDCNINEVSPFFWLNGTDSQHWH